jgi:nucleotide-binding universal stress UspA family protein
VSTDGVIHLRRILLPVDRQPDAQEAVIRAVRAAEAFGDEAVEIVMLHVNGGDFPPLDRPSSPACTWKETRSEGDAALAILKAANETVDLIVMATEGRQGIVDALRGSVTDRVVRGAPCPVLAVPATQVIHA